MLQVLKLFIAKRAQFVTIDYPHFGQVKRYDGERRQGGRAPRVEEGEEEVEVGRDARGQHSV